MALLLNQIKADMSKFPRDPKKYPRLRIRRGTLESTAWFGVRSLMFKSIIEGETDNYLTYVQFFDVNYQDRADKKHTEIAKSGRVVQYYKRPDIRENKVHIKCSCEDFRFRWEYPLHKNGGLIGRYRNYTRLTPPPSQGGAPYANEDERLGFCKHVWSLLLALRESGRIIG